jgi:CHC2 zinc finger
LGGKPVRVFLCHRPVSSIHPSNELMRRCLLRWEYETPRRAFCRIWQRFLRGSFQDRFRRHLTTPYGARGNSLPPKMSRLLPGSEVKGDEIRGKCPLCGGERSFSANPVKGVFNCFRCHKKKDVIDFVVFYRKIEPKQAAEWLVSLLPPAEEIPAQETEVEDEISALSLTSREVRLLQLMARATARYAGTIVSAIASEKLEAVAWKVVKAEIAKEFPDTALPEEGE